MSNIGKILKQAQRMQADMARVQEELGTLEKTFTAGGVVEAVARGDHSLVRIRIKPEAVDPKDVEGLEDLVLTAVNGALTAVREEAEARVKQVTGGLNIPGLV